MWAAETTSPRSRGCNTHLLLLTTSKVTNLYCFTSLTRGCLISESLKKEDTDILCCAATSKRRHLVLTHDNGSTNQTNGVFILQRPKRWSVAGVPIPPMALRPNEAAGTVRLLGRVTFGLSYFSLPCAFSPLCILFSLPFCLLASFLPSILVPELYLSDLLLPFFLLSFLPTIILSSLFCFLFSVWMLCLSVAFLFLLLLYYFLFSIVCPLVFLPYKPIFFSLCIPRILCSTSYRLRCWHGICVPFCLVECWILTSVTRICILARFYSPLRPVTPFLPGPFLRNASFLFCICDFVCVIYHLPFYMVYRIYIKLCSLFPSRLWSSIAVKRKMSTAHQKWY